MTAPWTSAFSRAIEAWPAKSWSSSNSFWLKYASSLAHPADVERPDDLAGDAERDDDHRLGLGRRAGDLDRARIEGASLARTPSPWSTTQPVIPTPIGPA